MSVAANLIAVLGTVRRRVQNLKVKNQRGKSLMEHKGSKEHTSGLSRSLSPIGSISITLSAVTPAASVFVIVPLIITSVGTGSVTAMALAAIVGIFMAFCWAELAAKFPVSGGDYALVF